jgi:hypothetical protein
MSFWKYYFKNVKRVFRITLYLLNEMSKYIRETRLESFNQRFPKEALDRQSLSSKKTEVLEQPQLIVKSSRPGRTLRGFEGRVWYQ